ncbi:hypothetical protein [Effusibacillus consociatus]|uniref:Uncharacterized protein n=1 Tax=Effusibacillus consociatus TaxID=1117041 RepID=A0ABV9Q7L9_9BACL
MNREQALQLAKEIIQLDLLRDELWEQLIAMSGSRAHEILRSVQNGCIELPNEHNVCKVS